MSVKRSLFWFRRDLRLADNNALYNTLQGDKVYLYFNNFISNYEFAPLTYSTFRKKFLEQSLTDVEIQLQNLGLELHKSDLNPLHEIPMICKNLKFVEVNCNGGCSWFERWQESILKKQLEPIGVSLNVISSERFPWMPVNPFNPKSIFTDYRHKMEPLLVKGLSATTYGQPTEPMSSKVDFNLLSNQTAMGIVGGESQAQWRLYNFVRKNGGIENYVDTRNGMLGHEYSTMLSPYLALGCCSAAQIYEAVKDFEAEHGATKSSYWLIFELLWRSYFKWIGAIHGHRLFITSGYNERKHSEGRRDKLRFLQWIKGETQEPIVNACMRELAHSGYMGNRARQISASYLIHDLGIEWTWGARYFEHMLIDYDPCSNYGNWAYLAGVGSDPRQSRKFNPQLQAEKFDPHGLYVNHWMGSSAINVEEDIFERLTK